MYRSRGDPPNLHCLDLARLSFQFVATHPFAVKKNEEKPKAGSEKMNYECFLKAAPGKTVDPSLLIARALTAVKKRASLTEALFVFDSAD